MSRFCMQRIDRQIELEPENDNTLLPLPLLQRIQRIGGGEEKKSSLEIIILFEVRREEGREASVSRSGVNKRARSDLVTRWIYRYRLSVGGKRDGCISVHARVRPIHTTTVCGLDFFTCW